MTPSLTIRSALRQGFTLIELLVVIAIIAILAAIIIPAVMAVQTQANNAKDLEQVRGIGNAFTLYHKKYNYFPSMVNLSTAADISVPRAADTPKGIALKLLVLGGYIEDVKIFFSPREASPDDKTLSGIQKELDPNKGGLGLDWAATYSYDAGHNMLHGDVPMFGNRKALVLQSGDVAHILTCGQTAKEVAADMSGGSPVWAYPNHKPSTTATTPDDIYLEEMAQFEWRDSYLAEPAKTGL